MIALALRAGLELPAGVAEMRGELEGASEVEILLEDDGELEKIVEGVVAGEGEVIALAVRAGLELPAGVAEIRGELEGTPEAEIL